ncbi:MAG: type II toxin-antitoxin system VapB family antitoxin [Hyphomicrobiales bacterium]
MARQLDLDEELLAKARAYTGLREKSALVREALKALIERESARRLARPGGSEPGLASLARPAVGAWVILIDTRAWVDPVHTYIEDRPSKNGKTVAPSWRAGSLCKPAPGAPAFTPSRARRAHRRAAS